MWPRPSVNSSAGVNARESKPRANGVHLGRVAMTRPDNYEKVKLDWSRGTISAREAARLLGVSHTTFRNWVGIKPREVNT